MSDLLSSGGLRVDTKIREAAPELSALVRKRNRPFLNEKAPRHSPLTITTQACNVDCVYSFTKISCYCSLKATSFPCSRCESSQINTIPHCGIRIRSKSNPFLRCSCSFFLPICVTPVTLYFNNSLPFSYLFLPDTIWFSPKRQKLGLA